MFTPSDRMMYVPLRRHGEIILRPNQRDNKSGGKHRGARHSTRCSIKLPPTQLLLSYPSRRGGEATGEPREIFSAPSPHMEDVVGDVEARCCQSVTDESFQRLLNLQCGRWSSLWDTVAGHAPCRHGELCFVGLTLENNVAWKKVAMSVNI